MEKHRNFVSKPRTTSAKISDRRLASGKAAASYLLSEQQRSYQQRASQQHSSQHNEQNSNQNNKKNAQRATNQATPSVKEIENSRYQYKTNTTNQGPQYTVQRQIGTKKWTDDSLLEWDPSHYRLFVGNLSPDVKDETLYNSFCQYPTLSKVKVPMEHIKKVGGNSNGAKGAVNKGYGFVSFSSAEDYLKAFREMNGKYVGQFPVQLKRAQTDIKASKKKTNRKRH